MFDHPEISYHFMGVDIERLSKHQTQFLVRAIGGPDNYQGGIIKDIHLHMEITPYEFKGIAKSFRSVCIKNGVSNEDADFIMKFVASHSQDIITAETSLIYRFMKPIYKFINKIKKL